MQEKQKSGQNPLLYLFAKGWQHSEGNRKGVVLFWFMFIVAGSINLFLTPFLWSEIMNTVQTKGVTSSSLNSLLWHLAGILGVTVTFWAIHGPARVLECQNAFNVRLNYRKFLLSGIMILPMDWHADHQSGDTIDKVEKGTNSLYSFTSDSFEIIYEIVSLIGSYAILVYFFPPAAYLILIMMLISMWIVTRFDKVLMAQYDDLNGTENKVSASVYDAIGNITTVIILRVEKLVFDSIIKKAEKPMALFWKNIRVNEVKWFLMSVCCTCMIIIVLGAYFIQHVDEPSGILIGSVYLLYRYLDKVSDVFGRFTWMYGEVIQRKAKVMNAELLAKDFISESFANHVLPKTWQKLQIKNLRFSYHGEGKDLHLEDVNLEITKGERIALIGESGCGKTTLLKVMRDLYHPQSLQLRVDDVEVQEGFAGIARAISLIPQDPEIFASTILENITLGAEHDIASVRRFTDMAAFSSVVDALPQGFASQTKEKGVNLSIGQQQRLALSRGLLACDDKDIVLLDEPTSSLDTVTESHVYSSIFREFTEKTIISSLHRLHLLPQFDKIYFFEKGRIIASGTLAELHASCVPFQKVWQQYMLHQQ